MKLFNQIFKKDSDPTPETSDKQAEAIASGWKNIASTIAILVIAPVMAILITLFVFQSYEVFGESMETSLQNGDRLIVQKVSKNWSTLLGNDYIPTRGEIIVFDRPAFVSNTIGNVEHLIKRVVGLPGERVVVTDGEVTIYNDEFPDGYDPDDDKEFAKDILTTPGNADITVGVSEVFVLGDNRTNSRDSRSFGAINTDTITGVATLRFIPITNFTNL
ncbi:MAG: signal peptidase I [Candidatus Saccharimonadales bacterium]|jgi:signal peptidase I